MAAHTLHPTASSGVPHAHAGCVCTVCALVCTVCLRARVRAGRKIATARAVWPHACRPLTMGGQELARKDAEIAEQKQKMEDMAVEFGDMLKETLDKARAHAYAFIRHM